MVGIIGAVYGGGEGCRIRSDEVGAAATGYYGMVALSFLLAACYFRFC